MAFDITAITDGPHLSDDGRELRVAWASSAPAGTTFQVYLDGRRAWSGEDRVAFLPRPAARARVVVGAVGAGEDSADFSGSLPAPDGAGARPTLTWAAGRYGSPTLASFRVYRGATPGGAVSYSAPVATVAAAEAGVWMDGFGMGGFGSGGFGLAEVDYSWTGPPMAPGTWHFGVAPADAAGNEGPPAEVAVALSGPPRSPGAFADGTRLKYAYSGPSSRVVTLSWVAAPPA